MSLPPILPALKAAKAVAAPSASAEAQTAADANLAEITRTDMQDGVSCLEPTMELNEQNRMIRPVAEHVGIPEAPYSK